MERVHDLAPFAAAFVGYDTSRGHARKYPDAVWGEGDDGPRMKLEKEPAR